MDDIINEVSDEALETERRFWEDYNQQLEAVRFYSGKDAVVHISDAMKAQKLHDREEFITTGLSSLTDITGGFKPGELVIISGPTGQGKTSLAGSFTGDFSDKGVQSLWFSYEVGVMDLAKRFGNKVPDLCLPQQTLPENMAWLEQRVWEGIAKFKVKAVFIDHLHYLISMDDLSKAKSSSLVIGHVMRRLKSLALRTRTTIFLISHMSKAKLETVPTINDLRDSSFVGQESDMVLFIWRKSFDKDPTRDKSVVSVEKNRRKGTLGWVDVVLREGRFYELASGR